MDAKYYKSYYDNVTTWKREKENGEMLIIGLSHDAKYIITSSDNPFDATLIDKISEHDFNIQFIRAMSALGFHEALNLINEEIKNDVYNYITNIKNEIMPKV